MESKLFENSCIVNQLESFVYRPANINNNNNSQPMTMLSEIAFFQCGISDAYDVKRILA